MRLAFLYDHPEWCIRRTADALVKYGAVDGHSWTAFAAVPGVSFRGFDAIRVGGVPLLRWAWGFTDISTFPVLHVFPTVASFFDLDQSEFGHRDWVVTHKSRWQGLVLNDSRQAKHASDIGLPLIYSKDRTDPEIFHPMPELRPTDGPLRIGWAGSTTSWKNVKHVDAIVEACGRVLGVTFVRQDRDKDGWLDQAGMVRWLNSIDIYVSLNDEFTCTPVPQLEAVGCYTPCITTKCGELWPWLQVAEPEFILNGTGVDGLVRALTKAVTLGRDGLKIVATRAAGFAGSEAFWSPSPAQEHTLALVNHIRSRA
jgi:hypothetical protein